MAIGRTGDAPECDLWGPGPASARIGYSRPGDSPSTTSGRPAGTAGSRPWAGSRARLCWPRRAIGTRWNARGRRRTVRQRGGGSVSTWRRAMARATARRIAKRRGLPHWPTRPAHAEWRGRTFEDTAHRGPRPLAPTPLHGDEERRRLVGLEFASRPPLEDRPRHSVHHHHQSKNGGAARIRTDSRRPKRRDMHTNGRRFAARARGIGH